MIIFCYFVCQKYNMFETTLIVLIIIITIIALFNILHNSGDTNKYNIVTIDAPNPEKTNDYRFYRFVEEKSSYDLQLMLPQLKSKYILKESFENAILSKITDGEFLNPLNFSEYFGNDFDFIGLSFESIESKSYQKITLSLCYIKNTKLADVIKNSFVLECNNDFGYNRINDFWLKFNIESHLSKNTIIVWDNDIDKLKDVIIKLGKRNLEINYVSILEIAKLNGLPINLDSLLSYFDLSDLINDDLSLQYVELFSKISKSGLQWNEKRIQVSQDEPNIASDISFVAFDVETANGQRSSICQIGLVFVERGIITNKISYLIQPPENKYSRINTRIHGISPKLTIDKPTFPEVWVKVKSIFEGNHIVAHNAEFDINCLNKTLEYYELEKPKITYDCTYKRTGKKLEELSPQFGFEKVKHHDALFDALVCAMVYLKLVKSINDISTHVVKSNSSQTKSGYNYRIHSRIKSLSGEILKPDFENANPLSPFYKKIVVFTGELTSINRVEAAEIIKSMGAKVTSSLSSRTNYVVMGKDPGPSKVRKIADLNENGLNIIVIDEKIFLNMIEGDR